MKCKLTRDKLDNHEKQEVAWLGKSYEALKKKKDFLSDLKEVRVKLIRREPSETTEQKAFADDLWLYYVLYGCYLNQVL